PDRRALRTEPSATRPSQVVSFATTSAVPHMTRMRRVSSLASFSVAFVLTSLNSPAFADTEACTLERHGEIPIGEAETAADLVCDAAIERLPQCTPFRVRLGRLEHQIVVTLVAECNIQGAPRSARERRLVLSGLDEIPVAAPRLADALASDMTVAETQTVNNLVSSETRVPKTKPAEAHAPVGLVGAVVPTTGTTTAGTRFGFSFGSPRYAFISDLTLTGRALVNTFGGFLYILPKDSSRDYSDLYQQSG